MSNWGKTGTGADPTGIDRDAYYTAERRRSLWSGGDGRPEGADLRHGLGATCHMRHVTDTPDGARLAEGTYQCAGHLVLQHREVLRYHRTGESAMAAEGIVQIAGEMLGRRVSLEEVREVPLAELLAAAHPSLRDEGLGHDDVAPVTEEEVSRWT